MCLQQQQQQMDVYKTAKSIPKSLSPTTIQTAANQLLLLLSSDNNNNNKTGGWDQRVPIEQDDVMEFMRCLLDWVNNNNNNNNSVVFDKDDEWAMRFVCCCCNLRARVFSIPVLSFHDVVIIIIVVVVIP